METLYRYFDAQGALLYIGVTSRINRRMREHWESSEWFAKIARCEFQQFPDRKSVLEAEREAIISEKPLHNYAHNRPKREKLARLDVDAPEPGISAKFKTKPSRDGKESRHAINLRLVQIKPMHPANLLHEALGVPQYAVRQAIEAGQLGYVDLPNSTGTKMNRYVSGWQALDWLESLGAKP